MFPYAGKTAAETEEVKTDFSLSKEEQWRYDHLHRAGFTESQAVFLALARDRVDLHKAVELAEQAGPALAYKILS